MFENSRLKAVSSGVVTRSEVVRRDFRQPMFCWSGIGGTHSNSGFQDLPYFSRKFALDKRQIIPTMVQAACELSIDILGRSRLRSDQ
jgi:hypothetical protein